MCDYYSQRMDGDHHHQAAGDLADIVRAGGAGLAELPSTATEWHLSAQLGTSLFPPPQPSSSDGAGPSGDALAGLPEPFGMSDYRASSGGCSADFEAPAVGVRGGGGGGATVDSGGGGVGVPRASTTQMPVLSPREIRPYPAGMMGGDAVKLGMPAMMPELAVGPPCAFDAVGGLHQMPSSRGGGGRIKRWFGTLIALLSDLCNSLSISVLREANPSPYYLSVPWHASVLMYAWQSTISRIEIQGKLCRTLFLLQLVFSSFCVFQYGLG
jgi:hypothetical protein